MTGIITKNMLDDLGLKNCYLADVIGNPTLDGNNMLQSTDLCDLNLTKLSSLNTSGDEVVSGIKLTVHIDPINLLNTIQTIADSSSGGTSSGIEFGDNVMIKLDQSSGTCNLETNICTYPNAEILENDPSEAPDLSNAVPKNQIIRMYNNYDGILLNNNYLYTRVFHQNNNDSITLGTVDTTDPFVRFDTKIYTNSFVPRNSLNPNQWNNKITNDTSLTFDNDFTFITYYGDCPSKVIDGKTYSCEIVEFI